MDTYRATNTRTGKFYIGSSKNFEARKRSHLNSRENYPFQNALRKNPAEWEWEVWSDECDEPILEQALLDMWFGTEQCLNLNPLASIPPRVAGKRMWVNPEGEQTFSLECPGEGWALGVSDARREQNGRAKRGKKESTETRTKKSKAHKGKKRTFSETHCKNISKAKRGNQPGARAGGLAAGSLPWWVNKHGETRRSAERPEGEWQRGRKWRQTEEGQTG